MQHLSLDQIHEPSVPTCSSHTKMTAQLLAGITEYEEDTNTGIPIPMGTCEYPGM